VLCVTPEVTRVVFRLRWYGKNGGGIERDLYNSQTQHLLPRIGSSGWSFGGVGAWLARAGGVLAQCNASIGSDGVSGMHSPPYLICVGGGRLQRCLNTAYSPAPCTGFAALLLTCVGTGRAPSTRPPKRTPSTNWWATCWSCWCTQTGNLPYGSARQHVLLTSAVPTGYMVGGASVLRLQHSTAPPITPIG
jgi:hypothetical protein